MENFNLVEILKLIGDPVLIVLTIVILFQMYFIFKTNNQTANREKKYFDLIELLTGEVNKGNVTLSKLATLIKGMTNN